MQIFNEYIFLKYGTKTGQNRLKKNAILKGRKEMFYLKTHSTHFNSGYMASDIWKEMFFI